MCERQKVSLTILSKFLCWYVLPALLDFTKDAMLLFVIIITSDRRERGGGLDGGEYFHQDPARGRGIRTNLDEQRIYLSCHTQVALL